MTSGIKSPWPKCVGAFERAGPRCVRRGTGWNGRSPHARGGWWRLAARPSALAWRRPADRSGPTPRTAQTPRTHTALRSGGDGRPLRRRRTQLTAMDGPGRGAPSSAIDGPDRGGPNYRDRRPDSGTISAIDGPDRGTISAIDGQDRGTISAIDGTDRGGTNL